MTAVPATGRRQGVGGWILEGAILIGGTLLLPFVLLLAGLPIILLAAALKALAQWL